MQDHYQALGIDKDADQKEIKRAFRKLSKEKHPDVTGEHGNFHEITEAYEVLSDPKKRRRYDNGEKTEGPNIEDEAMGMLASIFSQLLINDVNSGCVKRSRYLDSIKLKVSSMRNNVRMQNKETKKAIKFLSANKEKIHTDGFNLFANIMDQEIDKQKNIRDNLMNTLKIIRRAKFILKDYTEDNVEDIFTRTVTLGGFSTGTGTFTFY